MLIGSAGIPASTYREWAAAVLDIVESKGDAPRQPRALPRLFEAFEERLEAVRGNEFQWQRVNSALLPVEPEILAAAIAVVRASRRWGTHWEPTLGGPLSEVARVPLEIAHLMEEDESPRGEERDLIESSDALRELWRQFAEGR